jgi:hypothetical protein
MQVGGILVGFPGSLKCHFNSIADGSLVNGPYNWAAVVQVGIVSSRGFTIGRSVMNTVTLLTNRNMNTHTCFKCLCLQSFHRFTPSGDYQTFSLTDSDISMANPPTPDLGGVFMCDPRVSQV